MKNTIPEIIIFTKDKSSAFKIIKFINFHFNVDSYTIHKDFKLWLNNYKKEIPIFCDDNILNEDKNHDLKMVAELFEQNLVYLCTSSPEKYTDIFLLTRKINYILDINSNYNNTNLIKDIESSIPLKNEINTFQEKHKIKPLTAKEIAIALLISEGLSYNQIAELKHMNINNVRYYVKKIYSKLNVNNKIQASNKLKQKLIGQR
jgi:DNA-binding CsgD family transcriptional regulator